MFDFSIEQSIYGGQQQERRMTFFLSSPTTLWLSHTVREVSYLGNTRTTTPRARLAITSLKDVRLLAQPHFLYADHREAERISDPHESSRFGSMPRPKVLVEGETFSLTVIDRDPERSNKAFETRSIAVIEILCLIMTFLSKSNVTWFGTMLYTGDRLVQRFLAAESQALDSEVWLEDVVLHTEDIRAFISKAFAAYHKQAAQGINLRLPILLYSAAQSAPTVDEKFVLMFRGLENLIDLLDKRYPQDRYLTSAEMRKLRRRMRADLAEFGKRPNVIEIVMEKMPELESLTFKRRLLRQLQRVRIELSDIGGQAGVEDLVRVRNKLIHSADKVDIKRIVREGSRLQTILERMLLQLLGWRKRTNTPTYSNRSIWTVS